MPVKCPICETENPGDVPECGTCGRRFFTEADLVVDVTPIDGLEQTIHDPIESRTGPIPTIAELERTQIARKDLAIVVETVPDVERTPIEFDPNAITHWTVGPVEVDLGRFPDDGQRTPAPQDTGVCPWCNAPGQGAVCDNCGRRRSRFTAPVAVPETARAQGEDVLCPACFARVPPGLRCIECGVPFPVVEL
jgi:hypothetical protein